ncbi:MAG: hypothetical protein IIZ97_00150 [Prevotella sp.]|nr:hypothetical protein [Prevotella sp.]
MSKKKYTMHLLGEDIDVKMNMSVMIAYEEIAGTSFYGEEFKTTRSRYALLAAVLAASNADSTLADRLLTDASPKDFTDAFEVAFLALADFFEIPSVMKDEEKPKEGEQAKN